MFIILLSLIFFHYPHKPNNGLTYNNHIYTHIDISETIKDRINNDTFNWKHYPTKEPILTELIPEKLRDLHIGYAFTHFKSTK